MSLPLICKNKCSRYYEQISAEGEQDSTIVKDISSPYR